MTPCTAGGALCYLVSYDTAVGFAGAPVLPNISLPSLLGHLEAKRIIRLTHSTTT